ncbi:MAG: bifunctional UDP-N-acetylmuramoyl-L-alanyl-D-glutamate--2,6-diaminopimelate ligase MurE/UDP-N-acetylmuramoyl-tripeptide--D-alanyl-D-alanine ligase MurF [Betaproteobacteria bacterium]|nr:bifunctional UDP-N-acetylmuramoyl-L-alanyl-D-glutamate--2,6-diaminopimelate ligase MurE/UDP-N-acetylmuramoyl-tripeptide--D-alanyl-D-alanine ligase MurF [Betaproteobacteria bacterium]
MNRPVLDSAAAVLHALRALAAPGAALDTDSRALRAGDVFVAWPGAAADARRHVADALARGACAPLVEHEGAEAFALPPQALRVRGLKALAGEIADAWFGHPSRAMRVLAVTGTNGKTSVALWTAQALQAAGLPCGVIGTLGAGLPGALRSTGLTTPDPVRLHAELAAMLRAGVRHCAIEASSIGLEERRLTGLRIHAAAFSNLSQDHLDYHGDMRAYAAAKRRLFDWPQLQAAVLNADDPYGAELALHCRQRGLRTLRVSLAGAQGAEWQGRGPADAPSGMRLELLRDGARAELEFPLLGAFNASNLLLVCGLLESCELEFGQLTRALSAVQAPPGRMQALGGAGAPLVVVDYAHTPDALAQALQALRGVARRRGGSLWCVFGAGGDRDRAKRAPMTAAAEACADRVVLTSDNPRSESAQDILDQLLAGAVAPARLLVLAERAQAIAQTVAHADARDVVLLAGKGHEATQEVRGRLIPFSDAFHARAALAARGGGSFALRELADWTGGELFGDGGLALAGVSTDSRRIGAGDLFVALRGERFDAHDFLPQAAASGAAAVLAERGLETCGLPGVRVGDAREALGRLARAWRAQQPAMPLIAVAGSNGKTTVTQMISRILAAWLGEQGRLATEGNFNNDVGVPLTLLRLRPGHQAAVVEMGMNHPGEIARLAAIAAPDVALVNNAQREHLEFMHSVEAVARENAQVLQALPPRGVAVFPATDAYAGLWSELSAPRRMLRFALRDGLPSEASGAVPAAELEGWVLQARQAEDGGPPAMQLMLRGAAGQATLRLRLLGRHNAHNALAAAAASLAAGAPMDAVVRGLEAFEPVQGRMQRSSLRRADGSTVLLIDDTYNANPDSVRAAIDGLAALPGRRLLVLGDMGEVGDQGAQFHAEAGRAAAERGLQGLWTVGPAARAAAEAATAAGLPARHAEAFEQLDLAALAAEPADAVLVKGSRFMRMERVVAALRERWSAEARDTGGASREGVEHAA